MDISQNLQDGEEIIKTQMSTKRVFLAGFLIIFGILLIGFLIGYFFGYDYAMGIATASCEERLNNCIPLTI